MLSPLFTCLFTAIISPGPSVDADQFARLMKALHTPIRDVAFVYEGGCKFVGPPSYIKGRKDLLDRNYQGFYAFRSDGATLLDIYTRYPAENELKRDTSAMLKWKVERFAQYADRKNAIGGQLNYPGDAGVFFIQGTPERILYSWYFHFWPNRWISEPGVTGYEFQGWEEVDGHRCLRVQRDAFIQNPEGPKLRFWIDMERGGHPLKFEMWMGGNLECRVDRIRLDRLPIGEGQEFVWIPVSGMEETFLWESEHLSAPIFRSTYGLVHGSLRLNQGLTDDQFTLKSNLLTRVPALSKVRREFKTTPALRTDPEGVRLRLDASLAEADRQSEQLKASAPAAAGQFGITALQFGAAGLAVLLLGGVAAQKWRGR